MNQEIGTVVVSDDWQNKGKKMSLFVNFKIISQIDRKNEREVEDDCLRSFKP